MLHGTVIAFRFEQFSNASSCTDVTVFGSEMAYNVVSPASLFGHAVMPVVSEKSSAIFTLSFVCMAAATVVSVIELIPPVNFNVVSLVSE